MKESELAQRIKRLQPGESFTITTKSQREAACRIIKTLRDCELLNGEIITRRRGRFFFVHAL